jgi:hypothetical protein
MSPIQSQSHPNIKMIRSLDKFCLKSERIKKLPIPKDQLLKEKMTPSLLKTPISKSQAKSTISYPL